MFKVVVAVPCLIVIIRYVLPLPWPVWVKLAASLVLLAIAEHHLISRLMFGTMIAPEIPRSVVIVLNALFGAILLLAVFQLALDLVMLLTMLVKQQRMAIPPEGRYVIGLCALGLAAFGVSQAIRVPPVKDIDITIENLPSQFEGYQVLQLTDLHVSPLFQRPWTEAMVARANSLGADAILITGDLIDGSIENRRADVAPLQALHAPDGVYVIPGNHEYYFDQTRWMRHYETLGMQTLSNRHTVVKREDAALVIAGVTDLSAAGKGFPGPDLDAALAGAPDDAPIILMDHQPRNARQAARSGVALQLSGHTHGGMIVGLDQIVARANNGFVSGCYDVDGMSLYVSNGTALWMGFALRLGKPSELTRVTLHRG